MLQFVCEDIRVLEGVNVVGLTQGLPLIEKRSARILKLIFSTSVGAFAAVALCDMELDYFLRPSDLTDATLDILPLAERSASSPGTLHL